MNFQSLLKSLAALALCGCAAHAATVYPFHFDNDAKAETGRRTALGLIRDRVRGIPVPESQASRESFAPTVQVALSPKNDIH